MFKIFGLFFSVFLFLLSASLNVSYAVTVDILDVPDSIGEDVFSIKVKISSNSKPGTVNYLRASFFVPGMSDYFGYTKNNNGAWYNGNDYSQYFLINLDDNGSVSAKLNIKVDATSKYYNGSGKYGLKVRRYTASGKSYTWSNEVSVNINIKDKETVAPTPRASATPTLAPSVTASPVMSEENNTSSDFNLVNNKVEDSSEKKEILGEEVIAASLSSTPPLSTQSVLQSSVDGSDNAINSASTSVRLEKKGAKGYKSLVIGGGFLVALSAVMFIMKLFIF